MRTLQERVSEAMSDLVAGGGETGLQVAVVRGGQVVVDVAVGSVSAAGGPVTPGTLFWAGSTAKGVAASVAHVLAERGLVGYDLRVADVWPDFAAHGKNRVTLREILLHTAGVPGLPADTTVADLLDWHRMCTVVAAAEPWWTPGTRIGYHALTFGYLLGETLRRATGRDLNALLLEEISGPLGVADDVHFALPERLLPRVARQEQGPVPGPPEPGSPAARAQPPGATVDAAVANRPDVLTATLPFAGTMTARGVARVYSALLGQVPDVALVSPGRLRLMAEPAFAGTDEVMGFPTTWAFGYSPARPGGVQSRPGSTFGMVGVNGCAAYADIDSGVAVAVMRNRFTPGDFTAVTTIDRIVAGG
jgi:CubicO group peptidase (beta-lactamase class C family)